MRFSQADIAIIMERHQALADRVDEIVGVLCKIHGTGKVLARGFANHSAVGGGYTASFDTFEISDDTVTARYDDFRDGDRAAAQFPVAYLDLSDEAIEVLELAKIERATLEREAREDAEHERVVRQLV